MPDSLPPRFPNLLREDRAAVHDSIRDHHGIAGLPQIATALGVSRQRAHELAKIGSFPEPLPGNVGKARAWLLGDVLDWHAARVAARMER